VDGDQFEVLSLHCRVENAGAGSALLGPRPGWPPGAAASACGCSHQRQPARARVLPAAGLRLCALHAGSLDRDRALKPELPEINPDNRIPMRDLLELELPLAPAGPTAHVPS
jgi:hypothetical protein